MSLSGRALCDQLAQIWPSSEQATASAVCIAESGGNPSAACYSCAGVPETSLGPFQVNILAHPQYASWDLLGDPNADAQAAYQIWQSSGWGAWSTYTDGAYKQYLGPMCLACQQTNPLGIIDRLPNIGNLTPRGYLFLGVAAIAAVIVISEV